MRSFLYALCVALCLICAGCVRGGKKAPEAVSRPYSFKLPSPPALMDQSAAQGWMCEHFWDNFDFSDPTVPARIDSASFGAVFLNFVSLLPGQQDGGVKAMESLMEKASANAPVFQLFCGITRQLFWDPNSQLRNDNLYIPVLEARAGSPLLDAPERERAAELAQLAARNAVGTPAEDFSYLTIQGRPGSLYGISAPYTLIFFNNPGCTMCRDIRQAMSRSLLIEEMVKSGRLAVLALYPDEDTDLWLSYKDEIPSDWINARDPGCTIQESGLYDLKAIPSLYLLDADKTVLLKDCTDVLRLEAALSKRR